MSEMTPDHVDQRAARPAAGRVRRPGAALVAASLALLLLGVATTGAAGADPASWPLFRGDPQLTGVSDADLPAELEPLWSFEAGMGIESTAAIAEGTVYVGTLDGHFWALDLETGEERWHHETELPIKSSPSVFDGVVYFGDEAGVLHALDAATGETIWTYETGGGIVSSANLADGKLVFGSYDNHLYAVHVDDGSLAWRISTGGYVNGTPAVLGDRILSVGCDGVLRIVAVEDGEVLSSVEIGAYVGASAAVADGMAYFGTFENQVLGVDLGAGGQVRWVYEHPERKFPYYSSAALGDGFLLVGGRDKMVHALDTETGESLWTRSFRARVDSSPVLVGDKAFVGSSAGDVVALDVNSGEPMWQFDTGSSIAASPAVVDERLVIGTEDGVLYCFAPRQ